MIGKPYRKLASKLLYAASGTRPDIPYAIGVMTKFGEDHRFVHWDGLKRICKYLVTREDVGPTYCKKTNVTLECYVDADFGGCPDCKRSTTGVIILFNGSPVVWKSKRQKKVAFSTCEAEFIAASVGTRETPWVQNLLEELNLKLPPRTVKIDNQGTVELIKNNQVRDKTEHLDIKVQQIREINNKGINVVHIPTNDNIADVLTKPLLRSKFNKLLSIANLNVAIILLTFMVVCSCDEFLIKPKYHIQYYYRVLAYGDACLLAINDRIQNQLDAIQAVLRKNSKLVM